MSLHDDYQRNVKRDAVIVAYPKSCKNTQKCHVIPGMFGESAKVISDLTLIYPNRVFTPAVAAGCVPHPIVRS